MSQDRNPTPRQSRMTEAPVVNGTPQPSAKEKARIIKEADATLSRRWHSYRWSKRFRERKEALKKKNKRKAVRASRKRNR